MNLKSSGTLMAISLVSVCGWVAVVGLVIKPIFWVDALLSFGGGHCHRGGCGLPDKEMVVQGSPGQQNVEGEPDWGR